MTDKEFRKVAVNGGLEKMTNYERIKAMSVEEMVEFLRNYKKCKMCSFSKKGTCTSTECMYSVQQLLESEVQENDT